MGKNILIKLKTYFRKPSLLLSGIFIIIIFLMFFYLNSEIKSLSDTMELRYNLTINPTDKDFYQGYAIQVGGANSNLITKWACDDNCSGLVFNHLKPVEDWISTTLTNGGDMWVNCNKNYEVTSCSINSENNDRLDDVLGCFVDLNNKYKNLRNEINIECQK